MLLIPLAGFSSELLDNASVASLSMGKILYPNNIAGVAQNPAGVFYVGSSQLIGSYYALYDGARYNVLGYSSRFDSWAVTGLISQLYRGGIEVRDSLTAEPLTTTYSSKIASLVSFTGALPGSIPIALGGSLKFLYYDIYNTQSKIGWGVDLGLYKNGIFVAGSTLQNKISIDAGISLLNVIAPVIEMGNDRENDPFCARGSVAMNITLFPRYNLSEKILTYDKISIYFDMLSYPGWSAGIGGQYQVDGFKFRGGYNKDGISFGIGYKLPNFDFNYALMLREFGQLHCIDMAYSFGEIEEKNSDEIEEYTRLQKKAERLYEQMYKSGLSLFESKYYRGAKDVFVKTIPLLPADDRARQVMILCEDKEKESEIESWVKEYKNNNKYIAAINIEITGAIAKNDYDEAEKEYMKLEVLEKGTENTILKRKMLDLAKNNYAEKLIIKASNAEPYDAYVVLKEAYRISKDNGVLMQLNAVKEKHEKQIRKDVPAKLYHDKLYLLSAIAFAEDKPADARESFYQLKAANSTQKYFDTLEEFLVRAGVITRMLP